jgi:hypothetical protein
MYAFYPSSPQPFLFGSSTVVENWGAVVYGFAPQQFMPFIALCNVKNRDNLEYIDICVIRITFLVGQIHYKSQKNMCKASRMNVSLMCWSALNKKRM